MKKGNEQEIARIISRKLTGGITHEEELALEDWLAEDEVNRETYRRLADGRSLAERVSLVNELDTERASRIIRQRIELTADNDERKNRRGTVRVWLAWSAAACVVVAAVMLALNTGSGEPSAMDESAEAYGAVSLVLPSGEQIDLSGTTQKLILTDYGTVRRDGTALTFHEDVVEADPAESRQMTKLITGVGGDVFFVLADGTQVWLNSESELSFPLKFGAGERRVDLVGEAYFEVAAEESRQFAVYAGDTRTRVLGTSFNVKAYANEPVVSTTLLTGRVMIEAGVHSAELTPGTASHFMPATGAFSTQAVDVSAVVAWKEGYFVFRNEDLESVLRMLERWHGVRFEYDAQYSGGYTFNGKINKIVPLPEALEMISLAGGPSFIYEGRKVHVK